MTAGTGGNLRTRVHPDTRRPVLTVAVLQQKGGSGKTTLAVTTLFSRGPSLKGAARWSSTGWTARRARSIGARRAKMAFLARGTCRREGWTEPWRCRGSGRSLRGYDYVFLDGPPRLGDVTQSAAVAGDFLALLPIQPGPFDFWAVAETLDSLDQADRIREQLGRPPIRRVFVVNRAASNTRLAREAEEELRKSGGELAGVVHQRIVFPDAASRGESVLTSRAADGAVNRHPAPLARSERWKAWVSASRSQVASEARSARRWRRKSSATVKSGSSRTCLSTSIGRCG